MVFDGMTGSCCTWGYAHDDFHMSRRIELEVDKSVVYDASRSVYWGNFTKVFPGSLEFGMEYCLPEHRCQSFSLCKRTCGSR